MSNPLERNKRSNFWNERASRNQFLEFRETFGILARTRERKHEILEFWDLAYGKTRRFNYAECAPRTLRQREHRCAISRTQQRPGTRIEEHSRTSLQDTKYQVRDCYRRVASKSSAGCPRQISEISDDPTELCKFNAWRTSPERLLIAREEPTSRRRRITKRHVVPRRLRLYYSWPFRRIACRNLQTASRTCKVDRWRYNISRVSSRVSR